MRDDLGPVAADRDECIEFQVPVMIDDLLRSVNDTDVVPFSHREMEGVPLVGCAEYRPPLVDDAENIHRCQLPVPAFDESFIAVDDADNGGVVIAHRGLGDAADDGIQSGAVAASRQYPYSLQFHVRLRTFLRVVWVLTR